VKDGGLREFLEVTTMSTDVTAEIIASALRLPLSERVEIVDALQDSLIDESIDHGPVEPAEEVEAAWREEIGRRLDSIETGRVQTIPAEEAERMIRGDGRS
jgi:putative addiction module component (TIGR02574 family)